MLSDQGGVSRIGVQTSARIFRTSHEVTCKVTEQFFITGRRMRIRVLRS